jgi:hypothetical protein
MKLPLDQSTVQGGLMSRFILRGYGLRENEICDALVGSIKSMETEKGDILYLQILDGKDCGSEREVPLSDIVLGLGFMEHRIIGRAAHEPLCSTAFTGKFTYCWQQAECYRVKIDFHSMRGNAETDLKNHDGLDTAWIDELIGINRPPQGARASATPRKFTCRFCSDASTRSKSMHLVYSGPRGIAVPGNAKEIAKYVAPAEREMDKKVARRRAAST